MTEDFLSLQKMQVAGWVYLALITAGSWMMISWSFAWAVLAGGVISILSFTVAHRDVGGFFDTLMQNGEEHGEQAKRSKSGFIIKFWFRIGIIGIVLFLLIGSGKVNVFGLILGLSTVVFTITFTALRVAKRYFYSGRR